MIKQNAETVFSLMQLIEENEEGVERFTSPDSKTFSSLREKINFMDEELFYEVVVEKYNDYIWFSFDYGKPAPIDENLTNIYTTKKRTNQRHDDEAELVKQFFGLYCYKSNVLYLSNLKKKSFFERFLKRELRKNFIVKTFYKNANEFKEVVETINKVSFTEAFNLFNYDSKKRQALVDLTGTDAPEKFSIEADYKGKNKCREMIDFVAQIFEEESNGLLDSVVIQGCDDSDFEFVFNANSFTRKLPIACTRLENGKIASESVRECLVGKI